MNYYCTTQAITIMDKLTPEDIAEFLDEYSYPDGGVLITDSYETTCIAAEKDFKPTSRLIKYEDKYMSIEYFENGIPEWLDPIPGITINIADWETDHWEYTRTEFNNA